MVSSQGNMRHKRRKRHAIACASSGEITDRAARRARYVGSAEHKAYLSPAGPPALRSDATPCDPDISCDHIRSALAEGIRRGCVSDAVEQGLPKYVWGWLHGDLYEARHINGPAGTYKGYKLLESEYPRDPMGRLKWGGAA